MWRPTSCLIFITLELCSLTFPALLAITFDKVNVKGRGVGANSLFYPFQYRQTPLNLIGSTGENANSQISSNVGQDIIAPSNWNDILPSMENDTEEATSGQRKKRQGKEQGEPRTLIDIGIGPGPIGPAPLCFEREVTGTCRYRTAPDECFRHEWTAYATIVNIGYKKILSIPEGLIVFPGGHARVRVFLKSSCCNPIVQFIATDLFLQSNACLVDVRELQDLHPGEIAGIVIGSLLFVIILIAVIAFCVRRQQRIKREKETVIFGRSLTASKSRSNSINHRS